MSWFDWIVVACTAILTGCAELLADCVSYVQH
jgi:hypothetical protein